MASWIGSGLNKNFKEIRWAYRPRKPVNASEVKAKWFATLKRQIAGVVDRSAVVALLLNLYRAIVIVWCWRFLPDSDDGTHRFHMKMMSQEPNWSRNGTWLEDRNPTVQVASGLVSKIRLPRCKKCLYCDILSPDLICARKNSMEGYWTRMVEEGQCNDNTGV